MQGGNNSMDGGGVSHRMCLTKPNNLDSQKNDQRDHLQDDMQGKTRVQKRNQNNDRVDSVRNLERKKRVHF